MNEVGRKFGNLIAKFVLSRHLSVAELERRTRVSRAAIYRHLKAEGVPTVITRQKYSEGMGYDGLDAFDGAWGRESPDASQELLKLLERTGDEIDPKSAEKFLVAIGSPPPPAGTHNVRMETERQHPSDELEITLGVAACHWVPIEQETGFVGACRPVHGRFSIIIAGDCMEPDWRDGERVTFELLDKGETDFVVDQDYLIIRDGHATFKRCARVGEDEIELKAANAKFRERWKVLRAEIQRAAIARYAHVNRRKVKK